MFGLFLVPGIALCWPAAILLAKLIQITRLPASPQYAGIHAPPINFPFVLGPHPFAYLAIGIGSGLILLALQRKLLRGDWARVIFWYGSLLFIGILMMVFGDILLGFVRWGVLPALAVGTRGIKPLFRRRRKEGQTNAA